MVGLSALVVFVASVTGACAGDASRSNSEPVTAEPQPPSGTSASSVDQSATTAELEPNCESHRPDGFPTVISEEKVTVGDVRAIRIGTLPPEPTEVLLANYSADDMAVICVAFNGARSYSTYWVAGGGEVGYMCDSTYGEGAVGLHPGRDC